MTDWTDHLAVVTSLAPIPRRRHLVGASGPFKSPLWYKLPLHRSFCLPPLDWPASISLASQLDWPASISL